MVKGLADPVEHVILLCLCQWNRAIQGLKVGNQANKGGKRKHWGQRFWFVANWLRKKHERRRNEMFGDQNIEGFFMIGGRIIGVRRAVSVGTVLVHANKICQNYRKQSSIPPMHLQVSHDSSNKICKRKQYQALLSFSEQKGLIIVLDRMNKQPSAVMMMGMIMSRTALQIGTVLELVQALNRSYFECQRVVTILEQVFTREKSARILLGVEVLQFLIKNCNKNFHQAANKESFQRRLLGLLKRLRGKTNFLSDLRSNSDNWNRIEAKALYLIQLWYDAFILEESVYGNIIDNYKVLRKENVLFPPRSVNEKNIIFVKTESPILQNIEEIARADQQKFGKRLENMGMTQAAEKLERFEAVEQQKRLHHRIDLDEMSEKIAIVRSNGYEGSEMIRLIEAVRKDLEFGRVDPSQEKYWKDIKEAAELLIEEWEEKNVEIIREHERKYLEAKMGKVAPEKQQKEQVKPIVELQQKEKPEEKPQQKREELDLLDL